MIWSVKYNILVRTVMYLLYVLQDSDSGTADMNMLDNSPTHSRDSRKRTRDKV